MMNQTFQKIKIRLLILKRKLVLVPNILEKPKIIEFYRQKYNAQTFIETGTFLGDTVDFFKDKFHKIYSIELSHDLAAKAKYIFAEYENIEIVEGNSNVILPKLLQQTKGPTLFWLDGHYSSEFFLGNNYIITAKGEKTRQLMRN